MKIYAYLMRYANMSLKEIREMDVEMFIALFKELTKIMSLENGGENGDRWSSRNSSFKSRY